MDRLCALDARRIMQTLGSNLDREKKLWEAIFIRPVSDQEINEKQRDEAASWLLLLASEFRFLPETCGLAMVLLDRVLKRVKVRSKYLQCVAVTCLYIAAKTLEEDENIPSTPDLVRKSRCGCSFAEITRMEIVILTKLNWEIRMPSPVDFLHTIHVVLLKRYPHLLSGQNSMGPSEHLSLVMRKLLHCMTSHTLLAFKPSTIALALISLEMEQITPGWLRIVAALQRMTNVWNEQLLLCREAMAEFLGQQLVTGYYSRSRKSSSSAPQSKKRKVEHAVAESEDENMYEGIKQLYTEEGSAPASCADGSALKTSCSLELHQDCDDETKNATSHFGQPVLVI